MLIFVAADVLYIGLYQKLAPAPGDWVWFAGLLASLFLIVALIASPKHDIYIGMKAIGKTTDNSQSAGRFVYISLSDLQLGCKRYLPDLQLACELYPCGILLHDALDFHRFHPLCIQTEGEGKIPVKQNLAARLTRADALLH